MTTSKASESKDHSRTFNRIMYTAFVAVSVYFLLVNHDLSSAMSNLGIALIFDPFDQHVSWSNRPFYQRAWLISHVSLVMILVVYLLIIGFDIF